MRWLLAAATVVTLVLAGALVVRTLREQAPTPETPSPSAAAAPCPDADRPLELPRADLTAAPLLATVEPGVVLTLDGAPAGESVPAGRRTVVATAPGAATAKLELQFEPFVPVLLDARVTAGAVTVVSLGARCVSCLSSGVTPELAYDPSLIGDETAVAKALADADWVEASRAMRAVPPSQREKPELIRLLAALYSLAGRPSLARAELALLPEKDPLRVSLVRRDALDELTASRQLKVATARWNASTERMQRLTDRFVEEAHAPLMALSQHFNTLSERFARAYEKNDAIECEAALDEANAALADLVKTLRTQRPADCAWQQRISEAL